MLALLGLILIGFNYGIYKNEQILENGEIVLLQLAPVDPRSLMQGDYMILRYALEENIFEYGSSLEFEYIVIRKDEDNVAHFVRFYEDEQLAVNEKLLRIHNGSGSSIRPDTFLFQEGHAKYYEEAKYGVFKFSKSGEYLLTDLADENRQIISPLGTSSPTTSSPEPSSPSQ